MEYMFDNIYKMSNPNSQETTLVSVVWFACIWKARNKKCFHSKEINIRKIMEEVKVVSWNWLRFRTKSLDYNMYHYCLNSKVCLGDRVN